MKLNQRFYESTEHNNIYIKSNQIVHHKKQLNFIKNRKNQYMRDAGRTFSPSPTRKSSHFEISNINKILIVPCFLDYEYAMNRDNRILHGKLDTIYRKEAVIFCNLYLIYSPSHLNEEFMAIEIKNKHFGERVRRIKSDILKEENEGVIKRLKSK